MSATVHALFTTEVAIQYVRGSSDKQEDSLEQQRDLNTEDLSEFHYYEHRLKLAGVRV
jgi:hypothetical protein